MVFRAFGFEDTATCVEFVLLGEVFAHQAIQQGDGSDDSYTLVTRAQGALNLPATNARVKIVTRTEKKDRSIEHVLPPKVLLP